MEDEQVKKASPPSGYVALSYAYEAYFSFIINRLRSRSSGNIPNMGFIYRGTLNNLSDEFAENNMSFGLSSLGMAVQIHLNVVIMQAMNALSRYVQVMTQMRFTRSEKKQEKLQGLADRYLSQYLMLCNYVEKYSLQQNMDKTVEDAIEEYRSRGDEEDEIVQERQNILEDVEKVRDNEKRKGVELQNHEERMMLEGKKEEIVHLAEAEEEENEAEKAVVPDPNRIDPEDQQKELIPGTDIPKPRDREVHETDAEYEAFLKDYYEKAYGTEQAFEPASTALSTIPANTQLVPVSPQSTPQLSPEMEHQNELSLMMVELDQIPRRAPVMQPNGELDSMLVDGSMGPSGQVISPAVMSK